MQAQRQNLESHQYDKINTLQSPAFDNTACTSLATMLAALRDQENVVHSRQVPSKQQPKTPGARYPKTPGKFGQDNENAVTVFTKKDGAAGRIGGKDNILNTKGNAHHGALVTPLGRSRRLSSVDDCY